MGKRYEKNVLIAVALFYIAVAVMAVGILGVTGMVSDKKEAASELLRENTEDGDDRLPEPKVEPILEEPSTEEATEEEPTEEIAEEGSGLDEILSEAEVVEEPESGEKYYSFTANNSAGRLNVRKEPTVRAKVIARIHPGTKGYVLDIGEEWTHVAVSENMGYCANEYLAMQEIPEDEFPEELKEFIGTGTME
ncbi:MAG: hypothetical protein IJP84_11900 [Lachnospiraceae bacterium]|nr:hypothetical protein [Lachnospiraceae bacterium]